MAVKTLRKAAFLLVAQVAAWGTAYGADFWYQGSEPSTNRMAVASSSATSGTATEFRIISEEISSESSFSTYPVGLMISFR